MARPRKSNVRRSKTGKSLGEPHIVAPLGITAVHPEAEKVNALVDEMQRFPSVYVISSGSAVKIGVSQEPDRRIASLQTGHDKKLRLCQQWQLLSKAQAFEIEKRVHGRLRLCGVGAVGEWFYTSEDVATAAVQSEIDKMRGYL